MSPLFEPFTLRGLTLRNRIVMAPMTRSKSPGGVPNDEVAAYYRRRAEGEVGLIVTEGTGIDRPQSLYHPDIPRFHDEEPLRGWEQVVGAVHEAGGRIAPQLWHTGLFRANSTPEGSGRENEAEGPSGVLGTGEDYGRAMSEQDIADTFDAYAASAADAARLGFDCIELHGAHGYLIDQFFWGVMNRRDDKWGGETIAERSRFAAEIVRRVRAAIGDLPLIIRLSQFKQQMLEARIAESPAEMESWLAPLVDAGVDIFHCSQRRFWEPEFLEIDGADGLNFAGWAKKITGLPTISVGSAGLEDAFYARSPGADNLAALDERMERGEFDLIAVGRALIANPDWPKKMRAGRADELRTFTQELLGGLA